LKANKWLIMVFVLVLAFSVTAACGQNNKGAQEPQKTEEGATQGGTEGGGTQDTAPKSDLRISLVTDSGGVNDNSFNQSAWEGLQKLSSETGVTVDFLQSQTDADYIPNLNTFVQDGWDLTWGIGFLLQDAIAEVADQNPDAKLGIIDGVVDKPNVASVVFKEHEGAYLVGVVAAMMSKTGKIGFVGGQEIPVITRFEAGFKAGIKAIKPDANIVVNYTGSFNAADQGKAAAATMYNSGVDIIFHASGATGDGVFNEAKEQQKGGKKVWVIGVDKDQSITFGDDVTLTSMIKRVDEAVFRVSSDLANGNFTPGISNLGIAENGVGLPEDNPNLTQEVLDKVAEVSQQIASGQVTVPEEPAE
jgi:basic membrane protein A and related proteins